jgi:hypothetical protein
MSPSDNSPKSVNQKRSLEYMGFGINLQGVILIKTISKLRAFNTSSFIPTRTDGKNTNALFALT